MKTLVIAGVGPGLGLSLAKRFGAEGFQVGLVARDKDKLARYAKELKGQGIHALGFAADVTQEAAVKTAFDAIVRTMGEIDVFIYNAARIQMISALDTTAEVTNEHLQVNLLGAIRCARQLVPSMIERGSGTLLFTGGGGSGLSVLPIVTPLSIGKSGLRSYVHCLHQELADKGVFAGMLSVDGVIKEGTHFAPDNIADAYYAFYAKSDGVETFYKSEGG